jgi:hypothetical protein
MDEKSRISYEKLSIKWHRYVDARDNYLTYTRMASVSLLT